MRTIRVARVHVAVWVAAIGLLGCNEPQPAPTADQQPAAVGSASRLSLATDLPVVYRSVGELAGRGMFYAASERPSFRIDDGDHYHGYDGPLVWAQEAVEDAAEDGVEATTVERTQGLLYGIDDGAIVSAGYLIRQADLVSGKSLHGLTLRELDLPVAYSMTVDLIEGETEESNQYLFLWHFTLPDHAAPPMLTAGQLPLATSLPVGYEVFACDHIPETRFCSGMGRHFIDLSDPDAGPTFNRQPTSAGDAGVIYGEAADKLIFIEYVFSQQDFVSGVSWSAAIPLDGLPIPPIDNVHVLHFGTAGSTRGSYTVHMYFIPEEVYLAWDMEPSAL